MTILPLLRGSLSRQLAIRTSAIPLRVASAQTAGTSPRLPFLEISTTKDGSTGTKRSYATASPASKTAKKSSKPKSSSTKRTTAAAKKTKKTAKNARSKAKPKTGKPARSLTEKQKAAKTQRLALEKRKNLKQVALFSTEPKVLPGSAWLVLTAESTKGESISLRLHMRELSEKYANWSASEREPYEQIAKENRAKNKAAYKKWVLTYSPAEILAANRARHTLISMKSKDKHYRGMIKDDRLVKRAISSYLAYSRERRASGEFNGVLQTEAMKTIAKEWRNMSEAEKKPYKSEAEEDVERYFKEFEAVYGEEARKKRT